MEDRRHSDDQNWQEVKDFMRESRDYRIADSVRQEFIKAQVLKTNGRVDELEEWKGKIQTRIDDKRESRINSQALVTVVATVIMAVSAIVMYFKH